MEKHILDPVLEKTPLGLGQLYRELFLGGKGVRARLVHDLSKSLSLSESEIQLLCSVAESIHHSSLLHDDVIDDSLSRRGKPSAWLKFSKSKAILAGDYLLAHISIKLAEYGDHDLLKLTSQTIKKMVEGEWLQSEIKGGRETFKKVNQVHQLKTASLFEWCVKAPFLCKKNKNVKIQNLLEKIGQNLGLLFQRSDDILDFGIRNKENKNEFSDLKDGFLNFFGVYLKENSPLKKDQNLRGCQNLAQLKKMMPPGALEKLILSFDKMNHTLVESCLSLIHQLGGGLDEEQKKSIDVLKLWPRYLYFRDNQERQ